ncbi:MAG: class I mannose-6-phosphate isomerase [Firmicutes bacterium]|nr:class I mannose-6-phosphate isomerase [Bacillota bacterium]
MVLFFNPIFKETIWGGNLLKTTFHYPTSEHTGECWGICAHPNGMSTIKNGEYSGKTLKEIWENHKSLFGNHPSKDFPILVKIIDASDDLSIQVHPNDKQAKKEHSSGKNECWYIIDTLPHNEIIIGHNAKTKAEFLTYLERQDFHHLIRSIEIKKGDFFYIEAGTLHAILRGTLLLEVQQSSDITYRFYDYDRLYHNKKRDLHVEKAISVTKIPDSGIKRSIDSNSFDFNVLDIDSSLTIKNNEYGSFFVCLNGNGFLQNEPIKKGDFGFITSDELDISFSAHLQIGLIHLK